MTDKKGPARRDFAVRPLRRDGRDHDRVRAADRAPTSPLLLRAHLRADEGRRDRPRRLCARLPRGAEGVSQRAGAGVAVEAAAARSVPPARVTGLRSLPRQYPRARPRATSGLRPPCLRLLHLPDRPLAPRPLLPPPPPEPLPAHPLPFGLGAEDVAELSEDREAHSRVSLPAELSG